MGEYKFKVKTTKKANRAFESLETVGSERLFVGNGGKILVLCPVKSANICVNFLRV